MSALPDELLRDTRLFRGGKSLAAVRQGVPSGLPELDALLPWGGFPRGALSELLIAHDGIGELGLLLPALRSLCQDAPIALVQPPYIPYAPALQQAGLPLQRLLWIAPPRERTLWAAEQCLRAGCLAAVLLWDNGGDERPLRRLQVAAETGNALAFLFRPLKHVHNPSPAALRLQISPRELRVVKCRGAVAPAGVIRLQTTGNTVIGNAPESRSGIFLLRNRGMDCPGQAANPSAGVPARHRPCRSDPGRDRRDAS